MSHTGGRVSITSQTAFTSQSAAPQSRITSQLRLTDFRSRVSLSAWTGISPDLEAEAVGLCNHLRVENETVGIQEELDGRE